MTKETQRAELHKTIWRIANDLRGSVDGWDFKQYVLGMLFYRFISENLTAYLNELERRAGDASFEARHGREHTTGVAQSRMLDSAEMWLVALAVIAPLKTITSVI